MAGEKSAAACNHLLRVSDDRAVVLRHDADGIRIGAAVPHREGDPLRPSSRLLHVPDGTADGWQHAQEIWSPDDYAGCETHEASGPAMVNSPAYRSGWDAVFGKAEDLN